MSLLGKEYLISVEGQQITLCCLGSAQPVAPHAMCRTTVFLLQAVTAPQKSETISTNLGVIPGMKYFLIQS